MKLLTLCALFGVSMSKVLYDINKSEVSIFTKLNFDKQVSNQRDNGISIVHFYKDSDGKSLKQSKGYSDFSVDNKGIFRIGSVDCDT